MTAEEFRKYEGCRTTGKINGRKLAGGRIIGYGTEDDGLCLLAIDDERGWGSPSINDVVIPNDKDRKDYFDGKHKYLWVGKNNVLIGKDFNLTKILEGCEGVELFSEVFGVGELYKVDDFVCVNSKKGYLHYFNYNGRLKQYPDGNCLLWPSENNRDWSTFKKPVEVKDGDWVVCCDNNETGVVLQYGCITMDWKYIIPFDKFVPGMAEEEMKKLSVI